MLQDCGEPSAASSSRPPPSAARGARKRAHRRSLVWGTFPHFSLSTELSKIVGGRCARSSITIVNGPKTDPKIPGPDQRKATPEGEDTDCRGSDADRARQFRFGAHPSRRRPRPSRASCPARNAPRRPDATVPLPPGEGGRRPGEGCGAASAVSPSLPGRATAG